MELLWSILFQISIDNEIFACDDLFILQAIVFKVIGMKCDEYISVSVQFNAHKLIAAFGLLPTWWKSYEKIFCENNRILFFKVYFPALICLLLSNCFGCFY